MPHIVGQASTPRLRGTPTSRIPFPVSEPTCLRIHDAMQIQGWGRHSSLTQHHVNLPSMVRLVVEQMGDDEGARLAHLAAGGA